jgi:uncharacterized protein YlxP (DUF503 family)
VRGRNGSGFLGVLEFELFLPWNGSLKGKRKHLLRAKAQLHERLGASVAEVDHHDLWQRARLTLVVVRRDPGDVQRALAEAERYLAAQEYELAAVRRHVLSVADDLPGLTGFR